MAKGRTTKPLYILIDATYMSRSDVQALSAAGHRVEPIETTADLILHPAAHRWSEVFFDAEMLPIAIKAAQRRKAR